MLFSTALDWTGWLLMLGFIFLVMLLEHRKIKTHLQPEVEQGTLTQAQFDTAQFLLQNPPANGFQGSLRAKYRKTTRFYRAAAELAQEETPRQRLGEEREKWQGR